jgi:four helix bundle protein
MWDVGYGIWDVGWGHHAKEGSMKIVRGTAYRDLEIYRIAHGIGVETHHFSLSLPKFELYETGSQLRRSSKSVSANIVEGFCRRRYKAEFIRYLVFAHASCNETIERMEYVRDCHPERKDSAQEFLISLERLGGKLNRFIGSVEKYHKT